MKLHDSGDKRGLVGGSISRLAEECSGFRGWARGVSTCARAAAGSILAYVGACTPNGQGIYLFSFDLATGVLTQLKVAATIPSPSWIAIHPTGKYLYDVNEVSTFTTSPPSGSVSALSINRANGALTLLNVVSSQGVNIRR